jgi:Uma2 family endonuclease
MTVANHGISEPPQHIVLDNVSWEFYEHLLDEIGGSPLRVTYDQGSLEIMSPLPKHERWGAWIARLVELMCTERGIDFECLGSTTFRDEAIKKGLEPDECYYFQKASEAREMEEKFDPAVDPAPELAIEIDITSRSLPREPIYAGLGIAEVWRFDGKKLHILHLQGEAYVARNTSLAFPDLPMAEFSAFVLRMPEPNHLKIVDEFRQWVRSLPQ